MACSAVLDPLDWQLRDGWTKGLLHEELPVNLLGSRGMLCCISQEPEVLVGKLS